MRQRQQNANVIILLGLIILAALFGYGMTCAPFWLHMVGSAALFCVER